MKVGEIYGALKDGKPIGFKVEFVYFPAGYHPMRPYPESVTTIARVIEIKKPTVKFVVKYLTAEGKPRGWTLIEESNEPH